VSEAMLPQETPEEERFRSKVRAWLAGVGLEAVSARAAADPSLEGAMARAKSFQSKLFAAGFAGISWPAEFGGQGLTNRHEIIFIQEAARYDTGSGPLAVTLGMCAPTLLAHGTDEQRRRHIPTVLRGDEIWCQLFSEPGAGSDVAGLRTRAIRSADGWVITGQKTWTTWAQFADFAILLARTDPSLPKHRGLTMFLLDMHNPGVAVRELRQMSGGSNFNEVFLDGVELAAEAVIGEVNDGWRTANTTLMNERTFISASWSSANLTPRLVELAQERRLAGDQEIRRRIADVWVRETVLRALSRELLESVAAGRNPGPAGSLGKLGKSELGELVAELESDLLGTDSVAWLPQDSATADVVHDLLHAPGLSIAGGTKEIMRNIIAERILGLPKEPRVDADIPFSDLSEGGPARAVPSRRVD
jgi:alkylation response protein AidB-like acyl-CoA dehydrogenase